MRILFNHGLSSGELYSNTPERVIKVGWKFLNNTYGWNKSYEDAIADPFEYCLNLILNKVIDDKVRFKIPFQNAYIDFEIVQGDKFIEQRQNGRFQEIDFIESDFTGYFLNYYFQTRAYQKRMPIYIGGTLKQKFLNGINSGVRYYTTTDVTLEDFIDQVHEKYNTFTRAEIKRLLIHGFRRMSAAIKFGCAITIRSVRNDLVVYIGKLTLTPETNIKEYSVRRDRKLRKIESWKKTPFDGYYYIGLNDTLMKEWVIDNRDSRTLLKFKNIIPRKIEKELYYKSKRIFIFRFKRKTFKGYSFWAKELTLRNVEYIGYAEKHKFNPSTITWKQLIKEYE